MRTQTRARAYNELCARQRASADMTTWTPKNTPHLGTTSACAAKLNLSDSSKLGKKIRCPKCSEVFVAEAVQVGDRGVQAHHRQRARGAAELLVRLLEVVQVEMGIAERVHELARLQPAHLSDHQRQQGIGRDVERHAEEDIGAALVELA